MSMEGRIVVLMGGPGSEAAVSVASGRAVAGALQSLGLWEVSALEIDSREFTLPEDTVASIESNGLLGGKYVRLQPGGAEGLIPAGGAIAKTKDYETLEDQVGKIIFLATGGGAILDPENRRHLSTRGRVIYLHASVNQQLRRTRRDRNRPLLQTADPRARLEELMAIRDPLYREIADIIIETDGKRVRDVVKQIIQQLK